MSAATFGTALAQLVAFLAAGWLCARIRWRFPGRVEALLASVVGGVAVSVALMVANIATRGGVFGVPGIVPVALVALAAWSIRRRPIAFRVDRGAIARCTLAVIVGGALYAGPALIGGSAIRTGDPPWHLGWTEQLLDGEPIPVGPAPDRYARNAYPWGFHAVLATMTRAVPGSDPATAHEAMHLLLIGAIPLAAAAIARRVHPRAGWAAASAAGLIGGFGWLQARTPDLVTSPTNARYGGDLVVASPNSVYELFPPPLPRELGLVLLGASVALLAAAIARDNRKVVVGAGAIAGLTGLVSVPLFAGMIVSSTTALVVGRRSRWCFAFAAPAFGLFAFWAAPVVANYVRFEGFVDITPRLGVEWSLHVALLSWGLLLPLSVAGLVWAVRTRSGASRVVVGAVLGTIVVLGLSLARSALDWDIAGNATLLHQGRVWPPLHLLGAALGGVAIVVAHDGIAARRSTAVAHGAVGVIILVGALSPVLASIDLASVIERGDAGFVYASEDLLSGSFVREAAAALSSNDVLTSPDPELAFLLFQYSGVHLVGYDDPSLPRNDLRIRYRVLAEASETAGLPDPTHAVVPATSSSDPEALVTGSFEGRRFALVGL